MKSYSFTAYGHPNITSKQRNTLEFTKDPHVGIEGDCIIGVKADYSLEKIREITQHDGIITMRITAENATEEITMKANKAFDDEFELVIRKTGFSSRRTFGVHASKAAKDLSRDFAAQLANANTLVTITLIA